MSTDSYPLEDNFTAVAKAVFEHVQRKVPEDLNGQLTLDTSLYDVGLDSLTRMDVVNSLEEVFGMRFSEESLYDVETCRDLVDCIVANMTRGIPSGPSIAPATLRGQTRFATQQPATNLRSASGSTPTVPDPLPAAPANGPVPAEHHDVTRFPECVALGERLAGMAAAGVPNPFFRVNERVHNATATIHGREVLSYTSFDYLGLARDPRVVAAAKQALDRFGTSASASRLVGGENTILQELDDELARFFNEAALVLPSGYGTNASLFGHLFGPDDLILYDELAHNSIVNGAMLSRARRRTFRHNDFEFLDRLLSDVRGQHRRVAVAVEGVYSMDGDYPDLPRFIEVKRRHKALLYVDEAHSVGVMGATGRGICEHFGIHPHDGDLWMGTISKALGSGGGYIAGRQTLIQYLKYTTPAFVFATAASPANAAAALAALRIVQQEPQRVARLRERSRQFLQLARNKGLNTGNSHDTPVVPIILGNSMLCIQVSHALLLGGVGAQPILYPAVPEKASRVRFFITAGHTEEDICRTVECLADCIAISSEQSEVGESDVSMRRDEPQP